MITQNGWKAFVLVTLIFNNVRGQSCPSGLYYTTVSDINDCIACPEQSIGCTADLNVKTLDSCLACPFGDSMQINTTDEPSKHDHHDTTTLKSTHHDAKSLGLGYKYILAIVITIAVVAVILLLVFVAVRYKKCFQRSQSTYPRGNNVGDVPVRVQIYPNDDSEEKKHLNPHTSEQDESREKEWKDYATTEKGSPLAPENGTSQSHQTEINLSNQSS